MKRDLDVVKSLYDQGLIDKKQYEDAKGVSSAHTI
jgi:uncharacterized protein YqgQ